MAEITNLDCVYMDGRTWTRTFRAGPVLSLSLKGTTGVSGQLILGPQESCMVTYLNTPAGRFVFDGNQHPCRFYEGLTYDGVKRYPMMMDTAHYLALREQLLEEIGAGRNIRGRFCFDWTVQGRHESGFYLVTVAQARVSAMYPRDATASFWYPGFGQGHKFDIVIAERLPDADEHKQREAWLALVSYDQNPEQGGLLHTGFWGFLQSPNTIVRASEL